MVGRVLGLGRGRHGGTPSMAMAMAMAMARRFLQAQSHHQVSVRRLEGPDAGIVEVQLNRPQSKNAIGLKMLTQLQQTCESLHKDDSSRVVLLMSTVPGVFCAGADLKERQKMEIHEVKKFVDSLRSSFSFLEGLPVPTIAVIEGAALGGGLEMALSCDLRVCGSEATFGLPETSLAIIPGAGGTQRLPRLIGRCRAKELIFTGRRFNGKWAESIGLVNYCVEGGEAYGKALGIAREILQQGPLAVSMAKSAIDEGFDMDANKGMLVEQACYTELLHTRDRLEGLAAFAEKRKPCFRGE